jgi:WD40 repeat protein
VGAAKVVAVLPHRNTCFSLAFSPDGKRLLTGCFDGKVRTWDTSDWRPGRSWAAVGRVASLAVSAKGDLVAAGTDHGVQAWDLASGREVLSADEHERIVIGVGFTPDGKTLVSASEDHTLRLWHVASGRGLLALRGHECMLTALAVLPDGDTNASGDRDGEVRFWRAPALALTDQRK